jgi:hypothetical protein
VDATEKQRGNAINEENCAALRGKRGSPSILDLLALLKNAKSREGGLCHVHNAEPNPVQMRCRVSTCSDVLDVVLGTLILEFECFCADINSRIPVISNRS